MGALEQLAIGLKRTGDLLVADDLPVAEIDVAVGVCRDVGFVGDDDRGDALQAIEALKDRHDLDTRARIERARRFIRENDLRIVHQSARDGDALLLAAG